jgi:hypothetical protein|tara:strand:- start:2872 stop:3102 length:231 start_codon:yes stop_codon:yes gene_type:complete
MNPIGKVTIKKSGSTTISAPDFKQTPSLTVPELTDVTTIGLENSYGIFYKSASNTWAAGPVIATETEIAVITGGTF